MFDFALHDTIVALSTPRGRSGLAVIRASGQDAIRIVAGLVNDRSALLTSPSGSSRLLKIVATESEPIDEVVISVFRSPKSYTGEDLLEISCHGSEAIIDAILSLLTRAGCRLAEPGEFSRRAFYNGKLSLEEVELLQLKLDSRDEASLRGGALALAEKFEGLKDAYQIILGALALVDAQIDFGDSDDLAIEGLDVSIQQAQRRIQSLVERAGSKVANSAYFTVAIVGPPNVGKSSLFNALLNFERSIVSEVPGTTRDYLEAFIDLDGHRVKLVDTAGERDASEFIEAMGIQLGQNVRKRADLSLLVTDPDTRARRAEDSEIVVHNKVDLDGWSQGLAVSASTGFGISELRQEILDCVQKGDAMAGVIPGSELHLLEEISTILNASDSSKELAIVAENLRSAIADLAILLGFNLSEDSLNHIFANMCIGK